MHIKEMLGHTEENRFQAVFKCGKCGDETVAWGRDTETYFSRALREQICRRCKNTGTAPTDIGVTVLRYYYNEAYWELVETITKQNTETDFTPVFNGTQENWYFKYRYDTHTYLCESSRIEQFYSPVLYMRRESLDIVEKLLGREKIKTALRGKI